MLAALPLYPRQERPRIIQLQAREYDEALQSGRQHQTTEEFRLKIRCTLRD